MGLKEQKMSRQLGAWITLEMTGWKKRSMGQGPARGGITVNQGISLSFDPAVLVCISCKNEHGLLDNPQKPVIICSRDQNFVPKLPADSGCIAILKVESASARTD